MSLSLLLIDHVEVNAGFLVSVLFPVVTRFFWPWDQSRWGWNTILLELSIAGCLFPSLLRIDFGVASAVLKWVTAVFFGFVIANVVWRTVMVWNTQREGAARDKERVR